MVREEQAKGKQGTGSEKTTLECDVQTEMGGRVIRINECAASMKAGMRSLCVCAIVGQRALVAFLLAGSRNHLFSPVCPLELPLMLPVWGEWGGSLTAHPLVVVKRGDVA
jgi:hypothetical protein